VPGLFDVLYTPVLIFLVLVLVGTDLGVVVLTLADDVQNLASGTVLDDVTFHRPLLGRPTFVRLKTHSLTRF